MRKEGVFIRNIVYIYVRTSFFISSCLFLMLALVLSFHQTSLSFLPRYNPLGRNGRPPYPPRFPPSCVADPAPLYTTFLLVAFFFFISAAFTHLRVSSVTANCLSFSVQPFRPFLFLPLSLFFIAFSPCSLSWNFLPKNQRSCKSLVTISIASFFF